MGREMWAEKTAKKIVNTFSSTTELSNSFLFVCFPSHSSSCPCQQWLKIFYFNVGGIVSSQTTANTKLELK